MTPRCPRGADPGVKGRASRPAGPAPRRSGASRRAAGAAASTTASPPLPPASPTRKITQEW